MAKGSVRKKGKKWYYRFYVEDASGRLVQKEYAGTESKSETEKMLRQAMDDYDSKKFVARKEISIRMAGIVMITPTSIRQSLIMHSALLYFRRSISPLIRCSMW